MGVKTRHKTGTSHCYPFDSYKQVFGFGGLPMSSSLNDTSSIIMGWEVRSWVLDSLGALLTNQKNFDGSLMTSTLLEIFPCSCQIFCQ